MIASPNDPSYYPEVISMNPAWRNTLTHFIPILTWRDGISRSLIDTVYRDITVNKTQPLRDLSPETGAYFNECDSYEPEWQEAFWGKNYAKLKAIKKKVDPKNVLWCRHCVGSEALEEQEDGRLCHLQHYKRSHLYDSKRRQRDFSGNAGTDPDWPQSRQDKESGWNHKDIDDEDENKLKARDNEPYGIGNNGHSLVGGAEDMERAN